MGAYDQAARYATTAEPGFVLARLRPLTGLGLAFRRWFPTRGLPLPGGPDRDADLVALADDPAAPEWPWLLVFEVQSEHDPDKPRVLQLEALVYLCHARDTDRGGGLLLPLPVFVYLQGRCPEGNVVSVRTPTGRGFTAEPVCWEVEADDAATTLAEVESGAASWGALFWIALMAGGDEEAVIATWRRLLDEKVPARSRPDVAFVNLTFAEMVGQRPAWNRVLEGFKMTESGLFNEAIELGALREARDYLLTLLRDKLPEVLTPDVERAIADQPSLALLREWFQAGLRADTPEEFLAVLRR